VWVLFSKSNEQMPRIVIQNMGNLTIDTEQVDRKVIEIIHENGTDWMHACGKKGRCTTCKMIVIEGLGHLSAETTPELTYRSQNRLKPNERLTCQAQLLHGDLVIRVAEINKFPHLAYTE
jgi:2Fe-2S ferredoxin